MLGAKNENDGFIILHTHFTARYKYDYTSEHLGNPKKHHQDGVEHPYVSNRRGVPGIGQSKALRKHIRKQVRLGRVTQTRGTAASLCGPESVRSFFLFSEKPSPSYFRKRILNMPPNLVFDSTPQHRNPKETSHQPCGGGVRRRRSFFRSVGGSDVSASSRCWIIGFPQNSVHLRRAIT